MPTLDWIGKSAVVRHHAEVPFQLLEEVPGLSCVPAEGDTENLIVQGDNLAALKALLPRYGGQVKCIYIDPPYNTGNEGWVYNDAVNSPEIRQWLGAAVGKEAEDLSRHDKWLCMMYPRLVLLRQFLREDGAIFISIDDNEVASLRLVMDEIFGANNFIATLIWQKVFAPKNTARHFSEDHDFIVVYAKKADSWVPMLVPRNDAAKERYKNPDNDPRGPWTSGDIQARNFYSEGTYSITCPSGRIIPGPGKGMYWRLSKNRFAEFDADQRIYWGGGDNMPRLKRFLSEVKDGVTPQTLWFHSDVGHTQEAKKELLSLVDFDSSDEVFITPKPARLIRRILQIATNPGDLILDSFAGSGTTGHAVLALNASGRVGVPPAASGILPDASDDLGETPKPAGETPTLPGNAPRRFILVELDNKIASDITAERVRRVAQGYTNAKGESILGLGGGFSFVKLGKTLFDETGAIRSDVKFAELAEFVFFRETGRPLPANSKKLSSLLGRHDGRGIYLLFNGILGDRKVDGGNVLTNPVLASLPKHQGPKVIYAAACRLGRARLASEEITFKQTPYDLQV